LYDSDLHPELLEDELVCNYFENGWCEFLMQEIRKTLERFNFEPSDLCLISKPVGFNSIYTRQAEFEDFLISKISIYWNEARMTKIALVSKHLETVK
jgi:hypothetical protein